MSLAVEGSVSEALDITTIWKALQGLPKAARGEVEDKNVSQWIKTCHEHLCDLDEALVANDRSRMCQLFLKAIRISYIILPAHSQCAVMNATDPAVTFMKKLRLRIQESYEGIKDLVTPENLINETTNLQPSSPHIQQANRTTPPPSPTRLSPMPPDANMSDSSVSNSPTFSVNPSLPEVPHTGTSLSEFDNMTMYPPSTSTSSTPNRTNNNSSIDALFEEASALFGQLIPLPKTEYALRNAVPAEDAVLYDTGWMVHRREISEPDIFAKLYEDISDQGNGQGSSNVSMNLETGGGRDAEMFEDFSFAGSTAAFNHPMDLLPPSDIEDYVNSSQSPLTLDFDHRTRPKRSTTVLTQAEYHNLLFPDEPLVSPVSSTYHIPNVDYDDMISHSTTSPIALPYSSSRRSPNIKSSPGSSPSVPTQFNVATKKEKADASSSERKPSTQSSPKMFSNIMSRSTTSPAILIENPTSEKHTSSNDTKGYFNRPQNVNVSTMSFFHRRESNQSESSSSRGTPAPTESIRRIQRPTPSNNRGPRPPPASTYLPMISLFSNSPRPTRNRRTLNEQSNTQTTASSGSSPRVDLVPGAQTSDRLDPNDSATSHLFEVDTAPVPDTIGGNVSTGSAQGGRPSQSPSNTSNSSQSAPSPANTTSSTASLTHPIIERLRLHARSHLDYIRYMTFGAIVSYSSDLFSNMRMYLQENDYANAYTHGLQGIIIIIYVLPRHPDCRPEMGISFYKYIEIREMIGLVYKEMLRKIQAQIEQQYRPRHDSEEDLP